MTIEKSGENRSFKRPRIDSCLPGFVLRYHPSDFIYKDFHDTTRLKFAIRSLDKPVRMHRSSRTTRFTLLLEAFDMELPNQFTESTTLIEKTEVQTNPHDVTDAFAHIGHRDDFEHEPLKECPVRVRLTPSAGENGPCGTRRVLKFCLDLSVDSDFKSQIYPDHVITSRIVILD